MTGATLSAVLLLETGTTPVSLGAVVVTCVLTGVSVFLFGSRRERQNTDKENR